MKSLHDGKKFKCDVCGKEYSDRGNLTRHKKVAHEGKLFNCEKCGNTFMLAVLSSGAMKEVKI